MTDFELYQLFAIGGLDRFLFILKNYWIKELLELDQKANRILSNTRCDGFNVATEQGLKELSADFKKFEQSCSAVSQFQLKGKFDGENLRCEINSFRKRIEPVYQCGHELLTQPEADQEEDYLDELMEIKHRATNELETITSSLYALRTGISLGNGNLFDND